MADDGLIGSLAALAALLTRGDVPHDVEDGMIFVPTERDGIRGVQAMAWREGLVQFAQAIPVVVPPERVAAVESAVVRINHALPAPGLDFDHARRALAYRLVLPLGPRGAVEPAAIQACFRLAIRAAARLSPSLQRLADGALAADDIVADIAARAASATAASSSRDADGEGTRARTDAPAKVPPPFWLVDAD